MPGGASGKDPPTNAGDIRGMGLILGQEDPLKAMATHFSILAWRILWTEEPGGLQPVGSQRVKTRLKPLVTHAHTSKTSEG